MKNAQWKVTKYGLETVKSRHAPTYFIAAARLTETTDRGTGTFYDWPVHLAEKTEWVKIELFISAFKAALAIHAAHVDKAMLSASCAEARRIWKTPF